MVFSKSDQVDQLVTWHRRLLKPYTSEHATQVRWTGDLDGEGK